MLSKLIKYDFKSIYKTLIPIYAIGIVVALLNRLGDFASSNLSVLQVPAGFVTFLYFAIMICIPLATLIISIIKYYTNLVKDEGYLMHTLPVKKSNLIFSKMSTSLVAMITSLLISVGMVFVGCYNVYFDSEVFDILGKFLSEVNVLFMILIMISALLGYLLQLLLIYAAIAFGQMHSNHKTIFSVIYGIVLYNINQIISALLLLGITRLSPRLLEYMNEKMPPMDVLNSYLGIANACSVVLIIIYFVITVKTMTKKLNLD